MNKERKEGSGAEIDQPPRVPMGYTNLAKEIFKVGESPDNVADSTIDANAIRLDEIAGDPKLQVEFAVAIDGLLGSLPTKHATALRLRFGLDDPESVRENSLSSVGTMLVGFRDSNQPYSAEGVQQLLNNAIKRVRNVIKDTPIMGLEIPNLRYFSEVEG